MVSGDFSFMCAKRYAFLAGFSKLRGRVSTEARTFRTGVGTRSLTILWMPSRALHDLNVLEGNLEGS